MNFKKENEGIFLQRLHFDEPVLDYADNAAQMIKGKKHIILFGAGLTGVAVCRYLRKKGVEPACFCDNNPAKHLRKVEGLTTYRFEEIRDKWEEYVIVISCDAFMEITNQLVKGGVDRENVIWFEPDWLNRPSGQGEFIKEHLIEFEESFRYLEDQRSRDVFLGLLNYKITHNLHYIKGLADEIPYFDKEIVHLSEDEVFVDCGAFIGDTLIDFMRESKGKYKNVICIEPNFENVELLNRAIREQSLKNIEVCSVGLSEKKQQLCFTGTSEGGRIAKSGENIIDCDTIDNLCYEKYRHISFIKMDIEGSEYYALKGAKRVIERDHPTLAVCVYHKQDDFYVLPKLIKELYDGYRLYFRQYELSGEETVCYAVKG